MPNHIKFLFATFFSFFGILFLAQTTYAISLDTIFGNGGKIITSFSREAHASKIILQPDGKKIVVGEVVDGNNRNWGIARYKTNGDLDESFANNGIITKDFGFNGQQSPHGDFLTSSVLQQDGKIIIGGSSAISPTISRWTLARYNFDGNPDTGFGTDGTVVMS